jgi:hypothetical protein
MAAYAEQQEVARRKQQIQDAIWRKQQETLFGMDPAGPPKLGSMAVYDAAGNRGAPVDLYREGEEPGGPVSRLGASPAIAQYAQDFMPQVVESAMSPMTDTGLGESPGVEMARINAQSREDSDLRRLERETQIAEMKHAQLLERDVVGAQLAMGQITAEAANRAQLEFYKQQGATDIEAFQIQSRALQERQSQLAEHLMDYERLKAEAMASSRTRDLVPHYEKNILQTRKLLEAQNAMINDLVKAPPTVNAPQMPAAGPLGAPAMPGMTMGTERLGGGGLGAPAPQQAAPAGGLATTEAPPSPVFAETRRRNIPDSLVAAALEEDPQANAQDIEAFWRSMTPAEQREWTQGSQASRR